MSLAYVPPGVTVSEVVTPVFSPLLAEPTSICIVGPAIGYIPSNTLKEQTTLVDNDWYTLSETGINLSTLTVTGIDGTIYTLSQSGSAKDYVYDQALNRIRRDMPTLTNDGDTVAVYYTKTSGATAFTDQLTLTKNNKTTLATQDAATDYTTATNNSIVVMSQGLVPSGDYVITGAGTGTVTIARSGSPTVVQAKQKVYVDYTVSGVVTLNLAVSLNSTTPVSLPANSTAHVVKTAPISTSTTSIVYTKGAQGSGTIQTNDYVVTGTVAVDLGIERSNGTTTMGVSNDELQVTIGYQATPADYWRPTRVFSISDCVSRFGEALNTDGSIKSPLSFAANLAFANGATDLVVQALYHLSTPGDQTTAKSPGGTVSASATLQDWKDTLVSLQDIEDVNVLVPIISAGGGTENDNNNLAILQAVQAHVLTMANNQQYIVALCGQDSTVAGCVADINVLENSAEALSSGVPGEAMVHVSPASFGFPNPVTGATSNIGGQYVAAALSGMLAARDVSETLTRKQLTGISTVNEFRSETNKNTDAASGLLVVEARGGVIRVRHALTVAVESVNTRELSVIRAKYYMIESIRDTIDSQIIGQIIVDEQAGFTIQLAVQDTLENLITQQALVTYSDIQVRQVTADPTRFEVRFSYLPGFPLNYVDIVFSIDTSSGAITTTDSSVQGA